MWKYKPIGRHKTKVYENESIFQCTYWNTEIVCYDKNARVLTLKNGGYYTSTTKKRMNECMQYLNIRICVYQERFNWYVFKHNTGTNEHLDFSNGMCIVVGNIQTEPIEEVQSRFIPRDEERKNEHPTICIKKVITKKHDYLLLYQSGAYWIEVIQYTHGTYQTRYLLPDIKYGLDMIDNITFKTRGEVENLLLDKKVLPEQDQIYL